MNDSILKLLPYVLLEAMGLAPCFDIVNVGDDFLVYQYEGVLQFLRSMHENGAGLQKRKVIKPGKVANSQIAIVCKASSSVNVNNTLMSLC